MKTLIIIISLSLAIVGAWLHREREERLYRQRALAEMSEILSNYYRMDADYEKALSRALFVRDGNELNKLLAPHRRRGGDIRNRFIALENEIKERNGGALPAWLKDDRAWRRLDKIYGGDRR
jgi:hypothetical protein